MRTLLILRGAPASGKDTWVKNNNLEPYMLSADRIRLSKRSPILNKEGNLQITQSFDGEVWSQLFQMLEERMQRGEFVVVNGTHYRSELIQRYKKLINTYRYRTYIIDFTDVSKEECIRRNKNRAGFQRVPNAVIEKMCSVFTAEKDGIFKEVSNRYKVLKPSNAMKELRENVLYQLPSNFEKVYVFGDIHGCFEPIKKFFEENPENENYEYIFTGDYIDRGIQNKEVLNFINEHLQSPNFMFLEGNHETWLKKWSSKDYIEFKPSDEDKKILKKYISKGIINKMYDQNIRSNEFLNNTVPQIEGIDKGTLRQICRKLSQFSWFQFGPNKYLVCHGGVPCEPNLFISTDEFIKGVGKYEDVDEIYKNWTLNTDENSYLVHAHRNIFKIPVINNRCVNLCDEPELGNNMRILEIHKDGTLIPHLIQNTIYNQECKKVQEKTNKLDIQTSNELLKSLNQSKWIQKKVLTNGIISYNFTRDTFYKRHWDETVCKARGLFVDPKTEKVVARSYSKFWNWGEREETSTASLKHSLVFPVRAYNKENGFLGLISKDPYEDKLSFYSKSTNDGDFAGWVKDTFYELYKDSEQKLLDYLLNHNCTFVFECVRPIEDPHIIKYEHNELILLDVIENTIDTFSKLPYEQLLEVGKNMNFKCKTLYKEFTDFETLHNFKKELEETWTEKGEGYVFEDSNNFQVKVKSKFYKWWKFCRNLRDKISKGQNIKKVFTSELDVKIYQFMLERKDVIGEMSIPQIQELFYKGQV